MNDIIYSLPLWIIYVYIFIFGICIGSFLNVVILRGLKGEEIVVRSSHCPKCGNNLKWYMNIPVLSYIFLKGKCFFCGEKISIQYPIIELLNGLLYILVFYHFGFSIKSIILATIISFLIVLATTDVIETVIIDSHAYLLFFIVLFSYHYLGFNILYGLFCSYLIFILFEYLSLFSVNLIGSRVFGTGDSLILFAITPLFGLKNIVVLIFLSFLIQLLITIPFYIKSKDKNLAFLSCITLTFILVSVFILYKNIFLQITNLYLAIGILVLLLLVSIKNIHEKLKYQDDEDEEIQTYKLKDIFIFILKLIFILPYSLYFLLKKKLNTYLLSYIFYIPFLMYMFLYYANKIPKNIYSISLLALDIILLTLSVLKLSSLENEIYEQKDDDLIDDENEIDNVASFTMIAYGPALIISAIICLFYIDKIKYIISVCLENLSNIII